MPPFWQAFLFVLVAEISDKTQLVALAFASRFGWRATLGGILVATLLINMVSVSLGELLGLALPRLWIALAAGLAFIGFGLWTLRAGDAEGGAKVVASRLGPFLTVAATFFLAEMGDKTMLATISLSSQQRAFLPVWLGASLGMLAADGLAVLVGSVAGHRLPERLIRVVAAAIFLLAGVATIAQALLGA